MNNQNKTKEKKNIHLAFIHFNIKINSTLRHSRLLFHKNDKFTNLLLNSGSHS